jgi:hypothetical protein
MRCGGDGGGDRRMCRCRALGEASEKEKDEERAGDADTTVHNKLKRGN